MYLFLALAVSFLPFASGQTKGNIEVSLSNFCHNNGYAVVALFNEAKGFPDNIQYSS
jgi:uncharacterized protein (DUF2141 family)